MDNPLIIAAVAAAVGAIVGSAVTLLVGFLRSRPQRRRDKVLQGVYKRMRASDGSSTSTSITPDEREVVEWAIQKGKLKWIGYPTVVCWGSLKVAGVDTNAFGSPPYGSR
jgi:hypothetical protein